MELWTNWKKAAAVDKETPESKDETLMSQQGDRGSCGSFLCVARSAARFAIARSFARVHKRCGFA
jgi:hypothetical protein